MFEDEALQQTMIDTGARTLLGAPGIATSNKKLLGAPGLTTRSDRTLLVTEVMTCRVSTDQKDEDPFRCDRYRRVQAQHLSPRSGSRDGGGQARLPF